MLRSNLGFSTTNACFFVQGTQVSSSCTEVRNKKDLETTLRAFENNINQIIEDDPEKFPAYYWWISFSGY